MQDFLKVFESVRDELVDDSLLAGQPQASREWMTKVRVGWEMLVYTCYGHGWPISGLIDLATRPYSRRCSTITCRTAS